MDPGRENKALVFLFINWWIYHNLHSKVDPICRNLRAFGETDLTSGHKFLEVNFYSRGIGIQYWGKYTMIDSPNIKSRDFCFSSLIIRMNEYSCVSKGIFSVKGRNDKMCKMCRKTIWHWAVSGWGEGNGHWPMHWPLLWPGLGQRGFEWPAKGKGHYCLAYKLPKSNVANFE